MNVRIEMERLLLSMLSVYTYPSKLYKSVFMHFHLKAPRDISVYKSNPRCERTPMFIKTKRLPSRGFIT